MRPIFAFGAVVLASSGVPQEVLWDQQWDGLSPAYMSQGVTDDTSQSTYLFDDVFPQESWLVNQVIIYGLDEGVGSATTAVHLRFSRLPSFTNPGAVPAYFDSVGANGLQGNQLTVGGTPGNGTPLGLALPAGRWFLSVWVDRNWSQGGQWNWRSRRPVSGTEAYAHNPGGWLWQPGTIGSFTGEPPVDLSFRIEGIVVPEPATGILVGFASMVLWRRRCAVK